MTIVTNQNGVEFDIDAIATDLNGKADTDLINLNNIGKGQIVYNSIPSSTYKNLTLGASGASYLAPADGYVFLYGENTSGYNQGYCIVYNQTKDYRQMSILFNGNYGNYNCFLPVGKNDKFYVFYANFHDLNFRFYYLNGNSWEA